MKTRIPSFLHHKAPGQGFVVLNNRYYYLGDYHDPRTHLKYERTITEWLARGRQVPTPPTEITVKELLARFIVWAKGYYTPTGSEPDYELQKYARATKTLRRLYGDCRAVEFGPLALQAVRQQMIENGWCRNNVNAMVNADGGGGIPSGLPGRPASGSHSSVKRIHPPCCFSIGFMPSSKRNHSTCPSLRRMLNPSRS